MSIVLLAFQLYSLYLQAIPDERPSQRRRLSNTDIDKLLRSMSDEDSDDVCVLSYCTLQSTQLYCLLQEFPKG